MRDAPRHQMLRSAACGVAGTIVDFTAMACFVELMRLGYGIAAACASLVGAVVCFALNRYWAFGDASPLRAGQLARFAFIVAGAMLMVATTVHLLAGPLHVAYIAAKAIAAVVVFAIWTYPMQARVFAPNAKGAESI